VVVWELRVLGWDVSYGVEFTPDTEGGYTVIVKKMRKVPAHEEPIMKGSFKAAGAGKVVLGSWLWTTERRRRRSCCCTGSG
jgi:phosphatidylinositol transfer protein SFH5